MLLPEAVPPIARFAISIEATALALNSVRDRIVAVTHTRFFSNTLKISLISFDDSFKAAIIVSFYRWSGQSSWI